MVRKTMQLYPRPPEPPGFPPRSWQTAKENAERLIKAQVRKGGKKAKRVAAKARRQPGGKVGAKKKTIFPPLWKDYKPLFAYAQFGKCGFCESSILATYPGDVEHYRPKSEVSVLEALGRQQEASASNSGRRVKLVSSTGYYWLAYDWSNYLLACSICNAMFKGTLFPVRKSPRPNPTPKTSSAENPLLLNPFDKRDPAKHLKFQPDGFVLSKSPYGEATIDTCGLYRTELVTARSKIAMRVYRLARDLRKPRNRRQDPEALRSCYEAGADDAAHCGMVRSIIREVSGMSWEELVVKRAREMAQELKSTRSVQKKKELDMDLEMMGRERHEHFAVVRKVFEQVCEMSWDKLVSRRARQMAIDFLALKPDWKNDSKYELSRKQELYLMARDNPRHALTMKKAYESRCRMDWDELKNFVESRVELLWKVQEV